VKDGFGREIDYLRVSVTDRCNLRCFYCMPEEGVQTLTHSEILRFEEILRLCKIAAAHGIKKIRLTGGEPLVRRGIEDLVREIKAISGIEKVAITTNGILLAEKLDDLCEAGLDMVNISLDTLDKEKFFKIARREPDGLSKVLAAIDMCVERGLNTKVNVVAMQGINDNEFVALAGLAKDRDISVRFIEYMPVGKNDVGKHIPNDKIREVLEGIYGEMVPDERIYGNGPAVYYKPKGFVGRIGFISAMTNCFCKDCNRVRLTAEGYLKLCLQYNTGVSLRGLIRGGASDEEISKVFADAILQKPREHTFNDYLEKKEIEDKGMSKIGG